MAITVFLSPSNQLHNIGSADYGSEAQRMNQLCDIVESELERCGVFTEREGNEINTKERVEIAKEFFSRAQVLDRATFFVGDAGEIVPQLTGEYDFIFMDGPKTRYIEYLPYLKKLLKSGGILLCDNVLFNGMVSGEEEVVAKKNSIVVRIEEFLDDLYSDEGYITSIIPIGDGLSLSIKK